MNRSHPGSDTLGYEWDEDLDNGSRPAGVATPVEQQHSTVRKVLQDYGLDIRQRYSHASSDVLPKVNAGATPDPLVFGGGNSSMGVGSRQQSRPRQRAEDPRMRQATVNLIGDMGVQPATMQAGLVAASASNDSTPPTSTISSPSSGSNVETGTPVTISGAASDNGGVVGAVDVSVDGGATWHPANGRESWSYSWTPTTPGRGDR